MTYTLDNGKVINIPDAEIDALQKSNNISYNEAVYLWLCDEDYITDDTVEKLTEKAKKNRITSTIHQASATDEPKKARKPKEKKENPLKRQIIDAIFAGLSENLADNVEITITNDEKYINIVVDDRNFTINLVEHRKKKQ